MITQNSFNKQQKNFINYNPGITPSKKESSLQRITQPKPQGPAVSNIKIVGDNVTAKDYDSFFEGYNSARGNSPWQEKQVWKTPKIAKLPYQPSVPGEGKIKKLPYRPSIDGESQIKRLPYRPMEDGRAKISLYSGATPAYTKVNNTSQKAEEIFWDKIKDYGEDLLPYISPGIAIGRALENYVKEKHYGRNQYNVDLPQNGDEAKAWGWETEIANCHQFTARDGDNIKYISPDGKREVIFDSKGERVITADEDIGTYNYANPDLWLEHFLVDILPWIRYGNTPQDSTEWYERIGGALFGR